MHQSPLHECVVRHTQTFPVLHLNVKNVQYILIVNSERPIRRNSIKRSFDDQNSHWEKLPTGIFVGCTLAKNDINGDYVSNKVHHIWTESVTTLELSNSQKYFLISKIPHWRISRLNLRRFCNSFLKFHTVLIWALTFFYINRI